MVQVATGLVADTAYGHAVGAGTEERDGAPSGGGARGAHHYLPSRVHDADEGAGNCTAGGRVHDLEPEQLGAQWGGGEGESGKGGEQAADHPRPGAPCRGVRRHLLSRFERLHGRLRREALMRYKIALLQSDEGFSVSVPGLPGCWSQGATEAEALANIQDAIQEYLAARDELLRDAEVREVEVTV